MTPSSTGRFSRRRRNAEAVNSRSPGEGIEHLDTSVETDTNRASEPPTPSPDTPNGAWSRIAGYLVALVVAVFLVRLLGAPWPHFPLKVPDSFSFLKVARTGPLNPSFYFDERPIGFPLLAWTVGRSSTLIVVAQTLLYVGAFYALGRVLTRELSSRVIGVVAIVFLIAVAVEPRNALWNTLILSESLSSTCAVLAIAAWLRAASRPSRSSIRWAWLATAAWVLVRDTNVLPTMAVVVPAALVIAFVVRGRARQLARTMVSGAVAITLVCGYAYISQAASHRNIYPLFNNIGTRILPDPALTKWFVAQGMPIDDAVRARTGHVTWDDNEAFLHAPELSKIRTWVKSGPGSRVFATSLVVRSPDWWRRLHDDLPNALAYQDEGYDYFHVSQRLPKSLPAPFGEPRTNGGLVAGLLLAFAGIALMVIDRGRRLAAVFSGVMLLSAFVDIYVSYAGDSVEARRHLVGPLLRLPVILFVTIALGADSAVRLVRERRVRVSTPRTDEDVDV